MNRQIKGGLAAVLGGLCFGIIPLILLGISRAGTVAGTVCSMYRSLFAALITLPFTAARMKKHPMRAKAVRNLCLIGCTCGVTALCLYEAFDRIPSGIAIAVNYIYPLSSLLLAVAVYKEKVSRAALPATLLVLAGVIFLCDVTVLPERPVAGLLFAFASAVGSSLYYSFMEHFDTEGADPIVTSTFVNFFAALCMFLYSLLTGRFTVHFTAPQWGLLFLAGVVMIGAVGFVAIAVRNVGTVTTTVLGTLEPIVCTLGSALLLKDPVTPRTLIGAALILSAVILVTVTGKKE